MLYASVFSFSFFNTNLKDFSLFSLSLFSLQPYEGMSLEQAWLYVESGGMISRPVNCPEDLFISTLLRCFQRDPMKRPSFAELATTFQSELDLRIHEVTFKSSATASSSTASSDRQAPQFLEHRTNSSLSLGSRLAVARTLTEVYTDSEPKFARPTLTSVISAPSLGSVSTSAGPSGSKSKSVDFAVAPDISSRGNSSEGLESSAENLKHQYIPVGTLPKSSHTVYLPVEHLTLKTSSTLTTESGADASSVLKLSQTADDGEYFTIV